MHKHKHGQDWEEIDVDARDSFPCFLDSKIKCVAGVINVRRKRIKQIDCINVTASCPLCRL